MKNHQHLKLLHVLDSTGKCKKSEKTEFFKAPETFSTEVNWSTGVSVACELPEAPQMAEVCEEAEFQEKQTHDKH